MGERLQDAALGPYRVQAFGYLIWSLTAFSVGIRCGTFGARRIFRKTSDPPLVVAVQQAISVPRAGVAYIAA